MIRIVLVFNFLFIFSISCSLCFDKENNETNKFELIPVTFFENFIERKRCTFEEAAECIEKNFNNHFCLMNEHETEFLKINSKYIIAQYNSQFSEYFKDCIRENLQNYTTEEPIKIKPIFEKNDDDKFQPGRINSNQTAEDIHHECIIDCIQHCFLYGKKCMLKFHDKVIREIIPKCRDYALHRYHPIRFNSFSTPKVGRSNGLKDLQELSDQKIGQATLSSLTFLPQKTLDTFGNLTFAHLKAVKFILMEIHSRSKLCNPSSIIELSEFDRIQNPWIWNPGCAKFIPNRFIEILKNFTFEQYISIKNVTDALPVYRWIICSPEYTLATITPTSTNVKQNATTTSSLFSAETKITAKKAKSDSNSFNK